MATVAALERLALEAAVHGRGAPHREIARATGGLPVYADLGGGFAVKSNGTVVGYSWETREVQEANEEWSRMAIVRLVREHPAFAELLPERPADAESCAACSGTGIMMANFDCGHCLALGWVARRA